MELSKRIVGNEAHIEVARIRDSDLNEYLFGHLEDLREILDSIPGQYRGSAKIQFWGDCDLRVFYTRPATFEEVEAELADQRRLIESEHQWLKNSIDSLLTRAAALGVDPSAIGLTVSDTSYVVKRAD